MCLGQSSLSGLAKLMSPNLLPTHSPAHHHPALVLLSPAGLLPPSLVHCAICWHTQRGAGEAHRRFARLVWPCFSPFINPMSLSPQYPLHPSLVFRHDPNCLPFLYPSR
ncbi:hypothetical protein LZ32DRAFT_163607 [Colletotrichum eremochloae]|nr:hypothetical protein LZ32DRAFT_163607 [Colletotrichum eremochloae]